MLGNKLNCHQTSRALFKVFSIDACSEVTAYAHSMQVSWRSDTQESNLFHPRQLLSSQRSPSSCLSRAKTKFLGDQVADVRTDVWGAFALHSKCCAIRRVLFGAVCLSGSHHTAWMEASKQKRVHGSRLAPTDVPAVRDAAPSPKGGVVTTAGREAYFLCLNGCAGTTRVF